MHVQREHADEDASQLWRSVGAALLAAGPHTVDPPGVRTNKEDFVKQGLRMRRCAPLRFADLAAGLGPRPSLLSRQACRPP